jgi:hypothetical protein
MYCLCVNVYGHRVTTQLQLINISNFLFGVFGHCKALLDRRNVFVIKPACVAVLVSGLSSRVPRHDQMSDCVFLTYIF